MTESSRHRPLAGPATIFGAAVTILICLFSHLGAIGLVGPDEPRYAWVARAIAATGDWVTPRLYGQPWFEKPILYYWAAAIGFRLHLPAEWAARLPSAFATLAAAFTIAWLGWKHYGSSANFAESPAIQAPLLFSTSVAAIGFARAAAPEMLFSATLTLAMASAASVLRRAGTLRAANQSPTERKPRDTSPLLLFGAWLGVAVLAKGPAAIILAGGAIGLWVLVTKNWRAGLRLLHPLATASFCAVALPWYVLCARRNPDFVRVFIFQHNFERYLTPVFQHRQPFWFFGPILLLALLPWTVLLFPAAQSGVRLWREKSWSDSPGFFFACWAISPVAFFSFSQSKLPGYILPSIPPLALLCSVAVGRAFHRRRTHAWWVAAGLGITWIVFAGIALWRVHQIDKKVSSAGFGSADLALIPYVVMCAAALIALASVIAGHWRKLSIAIIISALSAALIVEIAGLCILPKVDPVYSARPHAELLRHDRRPDRIFTYRLKRRWDFGLAFYFERQIPEWSPSDTGAALVLTTPDGFREIEKLGRFSGVLDEAFLGILTVPVSVASRTP